jgi:hypothetical protein
MPERGSPSEFIQLLLDLQHRDEARRQSISAGELDPQLARLRSWQTGRLRHTYADLLADEQYRLACEFFLSDIYAARDFSQRDHDAEHLYSVLRRFLPQVMLHLLADAIRLNQLSDRLDRLLLRTLLDELQLDDQPITAEIYVQAYRLCDNFAERRQQIELLAATLYEAASGGRGLIFQASLHLARAPALHAGWFELYDFLERGSRACRPMRNVDHFVATIYRRELHILDKIFDGDAQPFDL